MNTVNEEYDIEFIPILLSLLQKGHLDKFGCIVISSCIYIVESESDAVQSSEQYGGVTHISRHILETTEEGHSDNSHVCDSFELLIMLGKTNSVLLSHDTLFNLLIDILAGGCETNAFKSISRILSVISSTDIGALKIEENVLVKLIVVSFPSLYQKRKKHSDYEEFVSSLSIVISTFCKKESLFLFLHETALVDELNRIVDTSACPMILRLLHMLESKSTTKADNLQNNLTQVLEVMNISLRNIILMPILMRKYELHRGELLPYQMSTFSLFRRMALGIGKLT